jgi:hypothetical protein
MDYCWASKRKAFSGRNYDTAREIFVDDPFTLMAYKQYADESKDEYRLAKSALFEYANIEIP